MGNNRKGFWKDAATAGLISGVMLSALSILSMVMKSANIMSMVQIAVFVGCLYYFGTKRAQKFVVEGFTFGSALVYILAFMMLAGVFVGFTSFVIMSLNPDMMDAMVVRSLKVYGINADSEQAVMMAKMSKKLLTNPLVVVISSMVGNALQGGVVGLFTAAFIRREAKPFQNTEE